MSKLAESAAFGAAMGITIDAALIGSILLFDEDPAVDFILISPIALIILFGCIAAGAIQGTSRSRSN